MKIKKVKSVFKEYSEYFVGSDEKLNEIKENYENWLNKVSFCKKNK